MRRLYYQLTGQVAAPRTLVGVSGKAMLRLDVPEAVFQSGSGTIVASGELVRLSGGMMSLFRKPAKLKETRFEVSNFSLQVKKSNAKASMSLSGMASNDWLALRDITVLVDKLTKPEIRGIRIAATGVLVQAEEVADSVTPAPDPSPAVPAQDWNPVPKKLCAYGNVNFFHDDDSKATAKLLADNNVDAFHMECLGAASQFDVAMPNWFEQPEKLAAIIEQWCRDLDAQNRGVIATIVNWNAKYKNAPQVQHERVAKAIVDAIKASGIRRAIVQAVSEPGSSKQGGKQVGKAKAITKYVRSIWSGPLMVNDPSTLGGTFGAVVIDHHVSSTKQIGKKQAGIINATSTDHSLVLAEMMTDGSREGQTVSISKLTPHVEKAEAEGYWYLLYHFWAKAADANAVAALGKTYHGDLAAPHNTSPDPIPGAAGPQLSNFRKDTREFYVKWDNSADVDAWPLVGGTIGWIVVNDVKVEQFRKGYGRQGQHLKNAYGPGSHGVAIKRGQTVQIRLQSKKDSKIRTNTVAFVWPWKGTRE